MNKKLTMISALFLFMVCLPAAGWAQTPYPTDDLATASVNGKYKTLLSTLYLPGDRSSFGDFYEWGYRPGESYEGYVNLPPGYWVYVFPNWYIWEGATGEKTSVTRASVDGKYSTLLKVMNIPQDEGSYGDFYDYGYRSATSYGNYDNIPAGYWVYVFPNWYIWRNSR